jgi:hypothetical protein
MRRAPAICEQYAATLIEKTNVTSHGEMRGVTKQYSSWGAAN